MEKHTLHSFEGGAPFFCSSLRRPDNYDSIVRDREKLNRRWAKLEKAGTELEQLRARQMRELAEQGQLTEIVPELVQNVLESITVKGEGEFEIRFLDGTEFHMKF